MNIAKFLGGGGGGVGLHQPTLPYSVASFLHSLDHMQKRVVNNMTLLFNGIVNDLNVLCWLVSIHYSTTSLLHNVMFLVVLEYNYCIP